MICSKTNNINPTHLSLFSGIGGLDNGDIISFEEAKQHQLVTPF